MPQIRRLFALLGIMLGGWVGWEAGSLLSTYAGIVGCLVLSGAGWSIGRRYAERNF